MFDNIFGSFERDELMSFRQLHKTGLTNPKIARLIIVNIGAWQVSLASTKIANKTRRDVGREFFHFVSYWTGVFGAGSSLTTSTVNV